jgi:hypothetical protein
MGTEELVIGIIEQGDPEYELIVVEIETSEEPRPEDRFVRVKVFAPRVPDSKWFRFRKDQTVASAAEHAAKAFGYTAGSPTFETKDKVVLNRSLDLDAAGVHNREVVDLVDAGTGV